MAQYQSFPDAAGDSRTLDKMKALRLPDLAGRTFLDVGCNEGFFCGFAKYLGATRVVGIDQSRLFVDRARRRFPECEFHCRGWDVLPDGEFDVILLASALHYADDQAALIHRLMQHLTPDGVLVLELGIFSSGKSEWVKVERGIDERFFPTMAKLREVLGGYAWKWMGPSVSQDGDPVSRHVIHASRRRPVAYLVMQPPAHGKTSIATHLFTPAGVAIVSGDQQLNLLAQGKRQGSPALAQIVRDGYSPFRLDQLIQRIFDSGLGPDLVGFWASAAAGKDFALDAYVPTGGHELVRKAVRDLGYLPVTLQWERADLGLLPFADLEARADAFYASLGGQAPGPRATEGPGGGMLTGYVDEVTLSGGKLIVRGWATNDAGELPEALAVTVNGKVETVEKFEKMPRRDVQKHLGLDDALVGFRLQLDLSRLEPDLAGPVRVSLGDASGPALRIGRDVDERWVRGR